MTNSSNVLEKKYKRPPKKGHKGIIFNIPIGKGGV
jgi:hypothetical protein